MTMERSYKRIASGMIAGFCVLNTQSIAKYSINYQCGGVVCYILMLQREMMEWF